MKMDLLQTTRYINYLLKCFGLFSYNISGSPRRRIIRISKKSLILGNTLPVYLVIYLLYQLSFYHFNSLQITVRFFCILVTKTAVIAGIYRSFYLRQSILHFFKELIIFSDLHLKCNRHFFVLLLRFIIFKLFFFSITSILTESFLYYLNTNFKQLSFLENIKILSNIFTYFLMKFYMFLIGAQFQIYVVAFICCLRALNEDLQNSKLQMKSYSKLFNLFQESNTNFFILLIIILMNFIWNTSSAFIIASNIFLHSLKFNKSELFHFTEGFLLFIHQSVLICVVAEELKREVIYFS